jgi:hypothetical protein
VRRRSALTAAWRRTSRRSALWLRFPTQRPDIPGHALKFQERWAEAVGEWVKMQCQALEAQCSAGLKNIEDTFRLAQAKDFEELRCKANEMWQRTVNCPWQAWEAQIRCFQTVVSKMIEPVTKGEA